MISAYPTLCAHLCFERIYQVTHTRLAMGFLIPTNVIYSSLKGLPQAKILLTRASYWARRSITKWTITDLFRDQLKALTESESHKKYTKKIQPLCPSAHINKNHKGVLDYNHRSTERRKGIIKVSNVWYKYIHLIEPDFPKIESDNCYWKPC